MMKKSQIRSEKRTNLVRLALRAMQGGMKIPPPLPSDRVGTGVAA